MRENEKTGTRSTMKFAWSPSPEEGMYTCTLNMKKFDSAFWAAEGDKSLGCAVWHIQCDVSKLLWILSHRLISIIRHLMNDDTHWKTIASNTHAYWSSKFTFPSPFCFDSWSDNHHKRGDCSRSINRLQSFINHPFRLKRRHCNTIFLGVKVVFICSLDRFRCTPKDGSLYVASPIGNPFNGIYCTQASGTRHHRKMGIHDSWGGRKAPNYNGLCGDRNLVKGRQRTYQGNT